jgi:hypothetical protein
MSGTAFRPTNWSQPQKTSITVVQSTTTPASGTLTTGPGGDESLPGTLSPITAQQSATTYYFDAVLSADHYTTRRFTDHPIQSGASVVDHSFQMPDRLILEVRFSDAMQSYSVGQYAAAGGKSVNAYQTFVSLQKSGAQLQVNTRMQSYPVMGIEEIRASDTNMTVAGAKFTIVLKQIIIANLATTPAVSSRPNQSQSSAAGTLQPQSTDPSVLLQHESSLPVPPELQGDPNPQLNSDPVVEDPLGFSPTP